MIGSPTILKAEFPRHKALILEWANMNKKDLDKIKIDSIGHGNDKIVYKVNIEGEDLVAVAATHDSSKSLLVEYNRLHHLHQGCSSLFPKPFSHYSSAGNNGELIIMEFLPHLRIDEFEKSGITDFSRKLAYGIGRDMATAHISTGMYSTEPHDGNILLLRKDNDLSIKFCDAIQFKHGSLKDLVHSVMFDPNYRPECSRFTKSFYSGLIDGSVNAGAPVDEKELRTLLNQYTGLF